LIICCLAWPARVMATAMATVVMTTEPN
jgi:hypothetical protein